MFRNELIINDLTPIGKFVILFFQILAIRNSRHVMSYEKELRGFVKGTGG